MKKSKVKGQKFKIKSQGLKTIMAVSLILTFSPAYAKPIKLTLDQAVEMAMQANYDINIAEERLNELQAVIGEARSGALPQIDATGTYLRYVKKPELYFSGNAVRIGANNDFSSAVVFSQPLYEAGKVLKALKAAKSEARRSEAELKDVRDGIKLIVKKTFYQVLLTDNTIAITKKTLNQLEGHLAAIQKRYNEGLESDYTLMRQEVEVSNLKPELSGAEQARLVLMNLFKTLLALPDDAEIELDGRLKSAAQTVPNEEELVSHALAERQDLVAASARIESMRQKVGVERGGYLPTLSLTANFRWQAQSDDFNVGDDENYYSMNAGAVLSWPIFDGLRAHYRVREAKSELKVATREEAKKRAEVVSEVKNARAAYEEAIVREASQKKALSLAEKAANIAGLRFREGLTSQLELNDTILARDKAERLYSEAVYDCLSTKAELERAIGGNL